MFVARNTPKAAVARNSSGYQLVRSDCASTASSANGAGEIDSPTCIVSPSFSLDGGPDGHEFEQPKDPVIQDQVRTCRQAREAKASSPSQEDGERQPDRDPPHANQG